MFKRNKTEQWIAEQESPTKHSVITAAMQEARAIQARDVEQKFALSQQMTLRLQASRQALQEKDDRSRAHNEEYLECMFKCGGLWKSLSDIEVNTAGLSQTKAKAMLITQWNVQSKILKCKLEEKVSITKCTLDELKQFLIKLLDTEVPDMICDLHKLIQYPTSVVGQSFAQQWVDQAGVRTWYEGVISDVVANTMEFKMVYAEERDASFMTYAEFLADVISGDLELHSL